MVFLEACCHDHYLLHAIRNICLSLTFGKIIQIKLLNLLAGYIISKIIFGNSVKEAENVFAHAGKEGIAFSLTIIIIIIIITIILAITLADTLSIERNLRAFLSK